MICVTARRAAMSDPRDLRAMRANLGAERFMLPRRLPRGPRACGALLCATLLLALAAPARAQVQIHLDPSTRHQTITGWEATMDWRETLHWPDPSGMMNWIIERSVNEMGINRFQIAIASGAENSRDWYADWKAGRIDTATWRCNRYATVQDDGDPDHIDPSGFHWSWLDDKIVHVALPMKQLVEANGEHLYISLTYVSFTAQNCSGTQYQHTDPEEYAEFILATYLHMRDTHGLVPDSLEVVLEPDNVSQWNGTLMGQAMAATAAKLAAHGFTPRFVAPSATNMGGSINYFQDLIRVPGVQPYVRELSYHRYSGVTTSRKQQIVSLAQQYGIGTSMLEWWHSGNTYHTLHEDLELLNNTAVQRGGLATDAQFLTTELYSVSGDQITRNPESGITAMYFKWVRAGATRIGASSNHTSFKPLAFLNANGAMTVVVKSVTSGSVEVHDLPAGRYQSAYSTPSAFDVRGAAVDVPAGGSITASIPGSGAIAFFRTDAPGSPPPPAPPPPPPSVPKAPILLED